MASELQENGEQHEDVAWEDDREGFEAANETQHSDQEHQDPDFSHDQASHGDQQDQQQSEEDGEDGEEGEEGEADAEAEDEEEGSEDGGETEYDPESISMTPVPQAADATPVAAAVVPSPSPIPSSKPTKPKKSGGFLVGDSDDEDDAPAPNAVAPPEKTAHTAQQPLARTLSPAQGQVGTTSLVLDEAPRAAATLPTPGVAVTQATPASDLATSLENRVKEDPRGEMDAWLGLMAEYRRLNQLDSLRQVYERFIQNFPQAAEIWVEWIKLELDCMNTTAAEALFQRSLLTVADVQLWTTYINYIRRRNDLGNDPNGAARQVISQSYEFVIENVGMDRESGQLWKDWIQFIKSAPGQVGGAGWQDQQKMDQLRKAFHRAIAVPMTAVTDLWKDYDQFELGLNKATGRQFIQKRSPGYMTAKSASLQMDRKLSKLQRVSLPRLAPMPGFAGDVEFKEQVELWNEWIRWEKEDPLVLKEEEPEAYNSRILYAYKQAVMALRFWPEMWVDAAEWCFANNIVKGGVDMGLKFLTDGIEANPESVLLALKQGDRIEMTHPTGDTDESKEARAAAIRQPYDRVLDTLYKLIQKLKERGEKEVAQAKQAAELMDSSGRASEDRNDDDDADTDAPRRSRGEEMVRAVKQANDSQIELMRRTISFVWTALCRAIRRVVGKGSPNSGLRKVFIEARTRGQLTSEIYTAVALIEHHVYKDIAGTKIFDRGAKLFPDDETFMLEYIKFLHSKDDSTNARVAFETCVNKLTQNPETRHKARSLYKYFHKYESQYGELASIAALEKRMAELWPEDPKLSHFSNRFSTDTFDPIAYRLIISPAVQLRPKLLPSIEQPTSVRNSPIPAPPVLNTNMPVLRQSASPAPQYLGVTNSPKRPFPGDDQDDFNRPRKVARGESPLKGAAGRRMDQQRRNNAAPLSRDITFLLGILPPAHAYNAQQFNAGNLVNLIRDTNVPDFSEWRSSQDTSLRQNPRAPSGSHARQPSGSDYPAYGGNYPNTRGESPKPRPQSPFDSAGRRIPSGPGYRNSPLSATAFEPPPQGNYAQPPAGQWPPPAAMSFEGGAPPNWAPPPAGYGQPPPQQYGQYQY